MAGRVHSHEWHEEVTTSLPSFQRLRQAKEGGLRTIVGIGTTGVWSLAARWAFHNVSTVQYVQKIIKTFMRTFPPQVNF